MVTSHLPQAAMSPGSCRDITGCEGQLLPDTPTSAFKFNCESMVYAQDVDVHSNRPSLH